ncbi:interleukin-17 receptor C isoform X3 [Hemibagrus wyckioides]|uniref:interleukin-17 receptor C isoform X3 n=1 Tax=Hemibagrus wyckioides TaxID=337641 RepID=UPI00266D7FA5|nr:interleukin-17 receptor C isoform X3 [Hemibagrus wyckioides]
MLHALGMTLVFCTTLIHTQSLELFNFTKEDALTCSEDLTDCNIKPGDICLYHDDRVYVSGLSAQALLCSSHKGLRPCLRIRINITAAGLPCFSSGIHEEISLSGEDSYNDRRSENRSKEHGSGLEPPVSTSMSVQVCYQGPDFSGSEELTFTLASSDDQTAQMWMSLIVELREDDFGSTVTVFSSNTHKPSFTKDIKMPAIDKVCSQGLAIAQCKVPTLYPEINPKTGMAELRVGDLPKDEVHELQACQRMEKDGPCLRLEWENPLMIPMSSVAPCLCFQIWWKDGPRKTFCPFLNKTVLSVSNISVSVMESLTYHSGMVRNSTALVWNITAPCRLEADIHLCKKTSGSNEHCHVTDDLRNSRHHVHSHQHPKWNLVNKQHWQIQGEFAGVERHPSLCVQIKVKGIEGHFDPVCPFETHRTHWSLFLLVSVLVMCLAVLGAYVLQGLVKAGWIFKWLKMDSISISSLCLSPGRVGDGQVVLLYPPDADSAVAVLVCHLGSALSSLGFGVSLELWSREELNALGPVPWLHSRLHRMQCHGGKVVLVLTPAAWARAEEWCRSRGEKTERRENYSDVFSASLSCILADYLQGRAGERFALVQFETQPAEPPNERGSMPELFRGLPLFSLPSQSLGFLTEITHGAHKGQKENERAESRRTRASVLRAGARILAGTLRELTGGAGYKLAEVSQDCIGLEKDDPWITIPLTLEHLTPPASPELHSENSTVN